MTPLQSVGSRDFASRFALRPQAYAWLLGAGTSAAAGIPTGYQMILDFKANLFCRGSGVSRRDIDPSDPIWQARIDDYFSRRAELPPAGDPAEYARAFECAYPTVEQRRQYIENAVRQGKPTIGHRVLGSLLASKLVHCIFTTNFDPLIETAATLADSLLPPEGQSRPTVAAIDSAHRAERCMSESAWPLVAKLHGDYQSVELKNTTVELAEQDGRMRRVLASAFQRFGLIVVGYSGRDASVMNVLSSALRSEGCFPAGIAWVTHAPDRLIPSVSGFLGEAHLAGSDVVIVECADFDQFATDLADASQLPAHFVKHVYAARPPETLVSTPLPSKTALKSPVLRCSALPVLSLPTVARCITLAQSSTTLGVRELLKASGVWATVACTGREVAAFGRDDEILKALDSLGATTKGTIELKPAADSWAMGLLYDALARALCRGKPLFARMRRNGHTIAVAIPRSQDDAEAVARRHAVLGGLRLAYKGSLFGKTDRFEGTFAEGVQIRLDQVADRWWCGFEPSTYVERSRPAGSADQDDDDVSGAQNFLRRPDPAADWRRERWAQRYNPFWTAAIEAWATMFAGTEGAELRAYGLKEGEGVDATFELGAVTAWSRPAHEHSYFHRARR